MNEFSTLITWSLESSMETSMSMESRDMDLKEGQALTDSDSH